MPVWLWVLATTAIAALCVSTWVDIFSRSREDVLRRNLRLVALWLSAITLFCIGTLVLGYSTHQWAKWFEVSTVKDESEVTAVFLGIFLFSMARIGVIMWRRSRPE